MSTDWRDQLLERYLQLLAGPDPGERLLESVVVAAAVWRMRPPGPLRRFNASDFWPA